MKRIPIPLLLALAGAAFLAFALARSAGDNGNPSFPSSAPLHAATSYVPVITSAFPLNVPVTGLDPGFLGWSGNVQGLIRPTCRTYEGGPVKVALLRNGRFVTGQVVNKGGGFVLSFEWPSKAVNGGGPADFVLVTNSGIVQRITLGVDTTAYTVLPAVCSS